MKEIICPECKKENIKRDGKRKTENRGLIQRYKCRECSHRFVLDDGFYRMRNAPQKITCAIDLFYRGVSTRKVQEHFQAFYPHNSSHKSIYKWIIKYSKIISKFTNKRVLTLGQDPRPNGLTNPLPRAKGISINKYFYWKLDSSIISF